MRVAVVTPYAFDAPGGVQDQVGSLVGWLRDEGHEAWAVAPGSAGPEGTRHVGRVVSVRTNRSRAPIALDPRVVRRVREAVADADVVHVHEPLMPMVGLGAVLGSSLPTVGTFHADVGGFARQAYRLGRPLLKRIVRSISVTTAVSPVAAAAVARLTKPRIIPNGLDVDAFRPAGDREPFRVAFLGRDEPRKGLDVLLAAWPAVRAAVPGARLRVMGAERPVAIDGVSFLGRVGDEEKRTELAAASVFCAPNLGGESFGIVLVEAMASGCTPVASDLPAFAAVLGDVGRLVPTGDASALGAAIVDAIGSAGAAAGDAAMERSRAFDRSVVLGAYVDAYRDALDSR